MNDEEVIKEFERREADRKRRADIDARMASHAGKIQRREEWIKSQRSIPKSKRDAWGKLHRLYAERDAGFDGDPQSRERTRLRIKKLLDRIHGNDPRWSTIGRGHHVPEHKKEEYEMRVIIRDMKRLLGINNEE